MKTSNPMTVALASLMLTLPSHHAIASELDAHEHGSASLDIAIDTNTIEMKFESPAVNIVGFEYATEDQQQLLLIKQAKKNLSDFDTIFQLVGDVSCQTVESSANWVTEHEEGHEEGHEEATDHHGEHGAFDPHAWHSFTNAIIYANNIAAGLAQVDPTNAGFYYQNHQIFVNEIRALKAEADVIMAALPIDKRTVVTPHDGFGYFADLYNLRFEAPQGLSTESEASAADVAKLILLIRKQEISAVFIESITDNRLMEQIANETGAVIGGKLYSDALSSEDQPASTYLDMMRHNTKTLSQALGD